MDSPKFPNKLRNAFVKFVNADGTATKSFPLVAAEGCVAVKLRAAGNITTSRIVTVLRYDGTAEHLICSGVLPAATTGHVCNLNLLDSSVLIDLDVNNIQEMIGGNQQVRVRLSAAVSVGEEVSVEIAYGEYPV